MANISLTKQQETFIKRKVKSGRYLSVSEVVREALRLLEARERIEEEQLKSLRRDLASGLAQIERGDLTSGSDVMASIRSELRNARRA